MLVSVLRIRTSRCHKPIILVDKNTVMICPFSVLHRKWWLETGVSQQNGGNACEIPQVAVYFKPSCLHMSSFMHGNDDKRTRKMTRQVLWIQDQLLVISYTCGRMYLLKTDMQRISRTKTVWNILYMHFVYFIYYDEATLHALKLKLWLIGIRLSQKPGLAIEGITVWRKLNPYHSFYLFILYDWTCFAAHPMDSFSSVLFWGIVMFLPLQPVLWKLWSQKWSDVSNLLGFESNSLLHFCHTMCHF